MHIMENNRFKVIIVEDVKLELKGTEEIFRHEIPNAEVIGTAMTENEFWELLKVQVPDMVLLDLGLGGSTTIGVEICSSLRKNYPDMKVLIFTGEVLNEKLWVDALNAGADGIILKTGELLTATDVQAVMDGKKLVFNYPILEKIVARFKQSVAQEQRRQEAVINYDIDEYDERLLRHLALGYTKEMITNLKGMPFGVKSIEKRQNELINRLFTLDERSGVNACRLVTRAFELRILDIDNLEPEEEYRLFSSYRYCVFSADGSCSLVLMDRKYLWAGEGAKPAQSRRNPVGIEACYGEFCPDTGIGHSNDAFFRVRHYGSFRGMGYVGEDSEKRKAHFP